MWSLVRRVLSLAIVSAAFTHSNHSFFFGLLQRIPER